MNKHNNNYAKKREKMVTFLHGFMFVDATNECGIFHRLHCHYRSLCGVVGSPRSPFMFAIRISFTDCSGLTII